MNTSLFSQNREWRLAFGIGAIFGLAVLLVRRNVPESPRWLFIHGREEEAERIVREIEQEVERETDQTLSGPKGSFAVRPRKTISFVESARVAFTRYPKRAILGLALFIGQAFLYNAFAFNLGTLLGTFYGVASGTVPVFFIVWALSNFAGPLALGRLFDTVGRKAMISLAYLTVSEIFPMETRALAIAFFTPWARPSAVSRVRFCSGSSSIPATAAWSRCLS